MGQRQEGGGSAAGSPFWRFSLRFYGQAGIPPACLKLQDASGVDVNVFLFLLFAASHRRKLTSEDVSHVVASCEGWRQSVVMPLRGARRFLRETPEGFGPDDVEALRQRVKSVELESERLQQELLYSTWPLDILGRDSPCAEAAASNVAAYASVLAVTLDLGSVETLLETLARLGETGT